jgi:lipopolysaccharide transport system ATP-binding protein
LLQLVCGTLNPTAGDLAVQGRVAALLELGAGFNPEFTGRENVYLSAAVLGLSQEEIDSRYDEIIRFSGIGNFIEQPVKTYSSGMYVRLAFSVATSVDPDILVVDEALSVGDGEFARKSFDRIMALKERGKTILFCSHSLYQVEAFCDRALWLDHGEIQALGNTRDVVAAYNDSINRASRASEPGVNPLSLDIETTPQRNTRLKSVEAWIDKGTPSGELTAESRQNNLFIKVAFETDPQLPAPCVAVTITDTAIFTIASAGSHVDNFTVQRDAQGRGEVVLCFNRLPLLKGEYLLHAFLMCERGIHIYDSVLGAVRLHIRQQDLEQGVVSLPHEWLHHA